MIAAHLQRQQEGKGKRDHVAHEDDLKRGIMIHQALGQCIIDAKRCDPATHRHDAGKVFLA